MDKLYKKLHIGCGPFTPSGWVNLDGSWNAKLAKFGYEIIELDVDGKPVNAQKAF